MSETNRGLLCGKVKPNELSNSKSYTEKENRYGSCRKFQDFFSFQIISNYQLHLNNYEKNILKNEILSNQGKTKSEEKYREN